MRQKTTERLSAKELRKQGCTVKEIAERLDVSKSSVSVWVRDTKLSKRAKLVLSKKIKKGQMVAAESKKARSEAVATVYLSNSVSRYGKLQTHTRFNEMLCALIYWCEGAKETGRVDFTNSDPNLIKLFLTLFRGNFTVDESKFRVCIHLHSYHNHDTQLRYWSKVTKIPKRQFIKPYRKKNSGKQIREGYQGCASIRYHDADLAKRLHSIAKSSFKIYK
ncbi:hypothetical protein CL653_00085 [bacterium]|nr:hypothetical protein [bacterium]|tara:strand:+ start:395 stop:1054 length:660 start_codon:yes stop_codon:yes gene_type:complete